jgi:polyisoprenyl-teichoic acid--peptidoglycan teichoic acid transferase
MKRWLWVSIAITAFFLACVGGLAAYVYMSVKHTAAQIYEPLPITKTKYVSQDTELIAQAPEVIDTGKLTPFSILLLGVDERLGDKGRSDTIIVLTVNPQKKTVFLFNIPRDTRTEIVKRGTQDKINHAYAFDGVVGSLETVEKFLDMPVDYYMEINMEGFITIVNLLDGVDVDNPFAFKFDGSLFPEGKQHLDGVLALKFSRMRYDDPRGDFGRNERQRQIVRDVLHRASRWNNALDFPDLLKAVGTHVKTNLTFGEMQDLVTQYRTKIETIESTEIHGKGSMINGIYYFIVDKEERDRVHDAMKQHLN